MGAYLVLATVLIIGIVSVSYYAIQDKKEKRAREQRATSA